MRNTLMSKILASAAAAAALGAATTPALAQPWSGGRHGGYGESRLYTPRVDSLEWKIDNAAQEGRISPREARALMREFKAVQPISWRVQTGQAGPRETRRLAQAVDRIEAEVGG